MRTDGECAALATQRNAGASPIGRWSGQLARRGVMTEVKTELASVEEHDNAVRKAIERMAYTLYQLDGFKDGHDQERAERELTIQGVPFSIEK